MIRVVHSMAKMIFLVSVITFFLYAHKVAPTTQAGLYGGILQTGRTITFSGKQNQSGSGSYDNDSQDGGYAEQWKWDFDYVGGTFTEDAITTSYLVNTNYFQSGTYTVAVKYYDNDYQEGNLYTFTVAIQDVGTATLFIDQKIISQNYSYLSREQFADFTSSAPNYTSTIVYNSPDGYFDFTSLAGFTVSATRPDTGYDVDGQIGSRMKNSSSISKSIVSGGDMVARVDFCADNTTGSTPRILSFEQSSYRFAITYAASTNQFKVDVNGSLVYTFAQSAELNSWYTIEIERGSDGKFYGWVYPRNESRSYANRYSSTISQLTGVCNVVSLCNDDYYYLANLYVGGFSQSTSYSDGLGRAIQSQTRDGDYDIIAHVNYGFSGRDSITWRPYRYDNNHTYDSNYASRTQSEYGGLSNPYTAVEYYADPLGRPKLTKPSGWTSTNEQVEYKYGSATVNGALLKYSEMLSKQGSGLTSRMDSRIYTDNLGRTIKSQTNSEGGTDTISSYANFTLQGNPYVTTDPSAIQSFGWYNFLGQKKGDYSVDGGNNRYIYDKAGRMRFMMDAAGEAASTDNILYWKYDLFGRVTEKGYVSQNWVASTLQSNADNQSYPTTPLTWRKKYTYDGNSLKLHTVGRLIKVETNNDSDNSNEIEEWYDYDKYGNAIAVYQKALDFSPSSSVTYYSYDHLGRTMSIQYPTKQSDVTIQNTTVNSGQLQNSESVNILTVGPSYSVNSGAIANLRATNTVKLLSGFSAKGGSTVSVKIASLQNLMVVSHTYNQLGRLIAIGTGSDSDYYAGYVYYTDGIIKEEKLNNNTKTVLYSYNHNRRFLTGITTDVFKDSLFYDNAGYNNNETFYNGLIGKQSFSYNYGGAPSNYTYKYQYDKYGRLMVADNSVDNTGDVGVGYSTLYYSNGRVQKIKRGADIIEYNYTTGNRIQSTDFGSFTYDGNGNVLSSTQKNISSLSYDPFYNKTTSVTKSGTTTGYQYDAAGERILKTENSTQTLYLRGLNNYPLVEKTSSGNDRMYIYGPTGIVAIQDTGAMYYPLKDHIGSIRIMLNQNNTVVASYDYDPYGKIWRSAVNTTERYQFTGQEFDTESMLHNFRARLYDDNIGQFYSMDPLRQFNNPYSYVGGNPISVIDPTGMGGILFSESEMANQRDEMREREAANNRADAAFNLMNNIAFGGGSGWSAEYGSPMGSFNTSGIPPGLLFSSVISSFSGSGEQYVTTSYKLKSYFGKENKDGVYVTTGYNIYKWEETRIIFNSNLKSNDFLGIGINSTEGLIKDYRNQLLAARLAAPLITRINGNAPSIRNLTSLYYAKNVLEKGGQILAAYTAITETNSLYQGKIGFGEYSYDMLGLGASEYAAVIAGGWAGAGVGAAFITGKIIYNALNRFGIQIATMSAQTDAAFRQGWVPGR